VFNGLAAARPGSHMHSQIGLNQYRAGVPSNEFEFFAAPQYQGRQRQSMWCWAACIQMILNYHGLYVSQEQIVQRAFGQLVNSPAFLNQMLLALSGWAPDTRGRASTIHATLLGATPAQIVADLSNNWPLIVGFRGSPIGHACVLTAVEYMQFFFPGIPFITKAICRDPWPGNFSKQWALWAYFQFRSAYLVRVWVNRL